MKLRHLHIEDYKMFKDFDISFVDENDEPLPIVVLAGVNGSGKTTLLEYLVSPSNHMNSKLEIITTTNNNIEDVSSFYLDIGVNKILGYSDNLFYFSTTTSLKKIKDLIPNYLHDMVWDEDILASESFKRLREYIENLFMELELDFEFASRNGKKNIFFKKKNSNKEFSIDALSTGEKTLMSKVLYLYLADIRDKVILIDEPELSLHPSWQNRVLKIYENFALKNNCQIIIATHSPHIIGSAKNEYIRILRKKEDGTIEAIDNSKAYGRDINSILFDVMGEVAYRPREFDDKIDRLFYEIDERNLEEAKRLLEELKKSYGEKDTTIMEATMLIEMFDKE